MHNLAHKGAFPGSAQGLLPVRVPGSFQVVHSGSYCCEKFCVKEVLRDGGQSLGHYACPFSYHTYLGCTGTNRPGEKLAYFLTFTVTHVYGITACSMV